MMFKYFFVVFLLLSSLNAGTVGSFTPADLYSSVDSSSYDSNSTYNYTTEFPIYVDGSVEYITFFLNSAAALTKTDSYFNLIAIALFIGTIVASWWAFRGYSYAHLIKSSATVVTAIGLALAPSKTIVLDKRVDLGYHSSTCGGVTPTPFRIVDNVPYIIAFPASVATTFGYELRELIVTSVTPITNAKGDTIDLSPAISFSTDNYDPQSFIQDTVKIVTNTNVNNDDINEFRYNLKEYVKQCYFQNASIYRLDFNGLMNPKGDLLNNINPTALGIESETITYIPYDQNDTNTTTTDCGAFFTTNLSDKYATYKDNLLLEVKNRIPECIDVDNVSDSLLQSGYILSSDVDVNGSFSLGSMDALASLKSFAANASFAPALISAAETSTQDSVVLANRMTAALSQAKMITEGAGGYHFFATMLPKSIHFIFGIVLFLGVLVVISAIVQPYERAIKVLTGYALSFVIFEIVKIAIVIINAATMFYESSRAANTIAEFNGNGASFENLPTALTDIATMTSITGTIGTIMVFAIPVILARGNFFLLMGAAMSAPGQKYVGNDVDTAIDSYTKKKGADIALEQDVARKRLAAMGIDPASAGVGEIELYNKLQQGMQNASAGIGHMATSNTLGAQSTGIMLNTAKQNTTNAELGSKSNLADAISSGQVMGDTIAGQMRGDRAALEKHGSENIIKGSTLNEAEKISALAGKGSTGQLSSALDVGFGDGQTQGHSLNETDRERKLDEGDYIGKDGKKHHHKKWDAEKVGKAMGHKKVAGEMQAQGSWDALTNEDDPTGKASDSSLMDSLDGYEATGREAENKMLGVGRHWNQLSDKEKQALMAKVKDNADSGFFGGIKGQHAELMAHGGVDGAIHDAVTAGAEKGTYAHKHAQNLRSKYGQNLRGAFHDQKLSDAIQSEIDTTNEQISQLQSGSGPLGKEDAKKLSALQHQKSQLLAQLSEAQKGMTLAEVSGVTDSSKLDSQYGQAIGVKANDAAHVSYAQNAMFGEMSQQQSTKAKIDTQGGVDSAVDVARTGAIESAKKEQAHAKNLKEIFGDSLDTFTGVDDAIDKLKKARKKFGDFYDQNGKHAEADKFRHGIDQQIEKLEEQRGKSSLDSVFASNDMKAIASMVGAAKGLQSVDGMFDKVSQNAQYKEASSIESESAKIKALGGVEKAVDFDVKQSSLKAQSDYESLDSKVKATGLKEGLSSEDSDKIAQSLAQIAHAEGAKGGAQTATAMQAIENAHAVYKKHHNGQDAPSDEEALNYVATSKERGNLRGLVTADGKKVQDMVVGEDGSIKTMKDDSQVVTKRGAKFEYSADAHQKINSFNSNQILHGRKQATYDKETGKISFPDKQTAAEFGAFVEGSDLASLTRKRSVDDFLHAGAEALGMSDEVFQGVIGGAVVGTFVGKPAYKAGKKLFGKDSRDSTGDKGKYGDNGTNSQGVNNNHNGTSYSEELQNVTKNREILQEKLMEANQKVNKLDERLWSDKDPISYNDYKTQRAELMRNVSSIADELHVNDQKLAELTQMADEDPNLQRSKFGTYGPQRKAFSPFEGISGKLFKGMTGFDAVSSGFDAYNNFEHGDGITGTFNTLNSIAAAAALKFPNPATGAAYAVTSTTASFANAANDADNYLQNINSDPYRSNRDALHRASMGEGDKPVAFDTYGNGKHGQMVFEKTDNGHLSINGVETKFEYGDFKSAIKQTESFADTMTKFDPSAFDFKQYASTGSQDHGASIYSMIADMNTAVKSMSAPDFSNTPQAGSGYSNLFSGGAVSHGAPAHVQTAFSQPPMANTAQAMYNDGMLPAMPPVSTGVVGTTSASNITQFVQQASIAQSNEAQLRTAHEGTDYLGRKLDEVRESGEGTKSGEEKVIDENKKG